MKFLLVFLFSITAFAQYTNTNVKATQAGTWSISNSSFGISGSLPAGINAIGSITNTIFGSTQSGIWNVGLSTGSNVIGSISNTGFGITGTLPDFASTPTFNIGTIAGVATETTLGLLNTSLNTIKASLGSVAAGTSGTSSTLTGGVFNTTPPTLTNGQQAALQLTSAGRLMVDVPAGASGLTDAELRASAVPMSLATIPLAANAATDRTTAASPYSVRQSDGISFIDVRQVRALTSADVVTVANPTTTVIANIGTTNGLALDTSVNSLLKPSSTLAAVTTLGSVTNTVTVKADTLANQANALKVDGTATTQPISAETLPLPTGASTAANQATEISSLATIVTNTAATVTALNAALPAGANSIGQVTTNAGTNTSTAALALETTQSAMNTNMTNGAAKTQVVDSANNTIASISDGNGTKALEVAIGATSFVFSSVNSSTTQLAAGATFSGAVETVVNQQSASILLTSDKNGTLVFTEYIDAGGTRVSRITTVLITASVPYSRSFVINGNYFKVAFTNNGAATTTTFNLNTAYGTIPNATSLGNGQVSLDEVNGLAFSTSLKGVQATNYLPVQMPHDSGRVLKMYSSVFTAATTEALVTLTPIVDGTAGTTATSFTVTAGKKLRIQQVCVSTRNAGAAGQGVVIQLRMTSTGAVTAASPLVGTIAAGSNLAIANSANSDCMVIPNGFELSGTQQFGVSQVGTATANNTVVVYGFEY